MVFVTQPEAVVSSYVELATLTVIAGGIATWWRRHNCHERRCPRLNWHGVVHPEHEHPVCKVHHPDHHATSLWARVRTLFRR